MYRQEIEGPIDMDVTWFDDKYLIVTAPRHVHGKACIRENPLS